MLRIDVPPSRENGLRLDSQVPIDKVATVLRSDVGQPIGRLENAVMERVDEALRYFLRL